MTYTNEVGKKMKSIIIKVAKLLSRTLAVIKTETPGVIIAYNHTDAGDDHYELNTNKMRSKLYVVLKY
ncbi:hypothetical protein [Flavivirga sp. 57AJ16]|uniref:hypothetical protein n=1 Tax=Flavivirga sp. 57AJ16 TaxID=3025307 RepID=UPI00236695C1|nr:hypothetical protein [Flavivirga sp. 57AJ16]MDD7885110.1 hypothetical protein [Flavivirga sp. 57AJ16]